MSGVGTIQVFKNPVPKDDAGRDIYIARIGTTDDAGKVVQATGNTIPEALARLARIVAEDGWPGNIYMTP